MQITSRPRLATTTLPTAPPSPPPDSWLRDARREAGRHALSWGNAVGTVTGGAGALVGATAGLYAGVLGGAVTGSAVGLGFGPVVAAVGSHGALNFLGSTFSTAGLAAKAGMVIGGVALGVGAWDVGSALGNVIGKPAGALLGAPVGFVKGGWQSFEGLKDDPAGVQETATKYRAAVDLNEMKGLTKLYATALGGAGFVAGGVGGALLGGSVVAARNLVSGLLAQNVSLAALTGAAGVGAAVGGALGAVIGGRGGFRLAKGLQKLGQWSQGAFQGDPRLPAVNLPQRSTAVGLAQAMSPWRVGVNIADLGLALGDALGSKMGDMPVSGVLAAAHLAAGVIHLLNNSNDGSGPGTAARTWHISSAVADTITAAGHFVGLTQPGLWGLPLVGLGVALNTVADFRYRRSPEGQSPETPEARAADWTANGLVAGGSALLGAVGGLGALGGSSELSAVLGVGEVAAGVVHGFSSMNGTSEAQHRRKLSLTQGHLLLALGNVAVSNGAGPWALAPIVGGIVSNALSQIPG